MVWFFFISWRVVWKLCVGGGWVYDHNTFHKCHFYNRLVFNIIFNLTILSKLGPAPIRSKFPNYAFCYLIFRNISLCFFFLSYLVWILACCKRIHIQSKIYIKQSCSLFKRFHTFSFHSRRINLSESYIRIIRSKQRHSNNTKLWFAH